MDRTLRVEQHTWAGNSPEAWQLCARDLRAAATVLRERRESIESGSAPVLTALIHPAELMLDGMAIECLLKALWVKRGNKLARDGKYLGVPDAGAHDLVQLAGAVKLILSDLEKDTLRRLSHFIEYGGRYPVPKNAEKLRLTSAPAGGRAVATTWSTPTDYVHFEAAVSRLDQLLNER
ncbi:MAG: hypothetical protein WB781_25900 [Candidatus Sulfotelmatobacter sp.]